MIRLSLKILWGAALLALAAGSCGCQTVQFYSQAIRGESQLLRGREPIAEILRDPNARPMLKERLELVLRLRSFAATELALPVDKHYLSYVDLGRRFAVWNVHAAREFSLAPKTWWYPLVGRLKYRGYFEESDAREYAQHLREHGYETCVEGVEAFSTLGWFADPLLNTFIDRAEPDLAEIIFHELAHQKVFLSGDTDFNEAFATAVAEEGVRRWYAATDDQAGYERFLAAQDRHRQFVALVLGARERLRSVYGDRENTKALPPPGLNSAADTLREAKSRIRAELRADYNRLKEGWGGYSGYDTWFAGPLNNAQLNTVATYYQLVPGFRALLEACGGDMPAFYTAVRAMRKLSKDDRRRGLEGPLTTAAR